MRLQDERDADPSEMWGVNPHRRCICFNWNNYDGTCNYCEWEQENNNEEGTTNDN